MIFFDWRYDWVLNKIYNYIVYWYLNVVFIDLEIVYYLVDMIVIDIVDIKV